MRNSTSVSSSIPRFAGQREIFAHEQLYGLDVLLQRLAQILLI
jgi:hypothetical protein